jgi:hypothetical protein
MSNIYDDIKVHAEQWAYDDWRFIEDYEVSVSRSYGWACIHISNYRYYPHPEQLPVMKQSLVDLVGCIIVLQKFVYEEYPCLKYDTDYLIKNIKEERKRQTEIYGIQNHILSRWGIILAEEYGEMSKAICDQIYNTYPDVDYIGDIIEEAMHTAAVAVQIIEKIDAGEITNALE